ncbi:hypothetical protein BOTBODRAFT_27778 [Botryobasidium botryosum FD-172 SS1]|uniref:PHD-type domain-containing protein n=1 Tax=Botryobasidium botryosum (strain FD-172 SS1) TaxID=930990 RepID=A0A067MXP7_BOTB1|nr:hypothetical protein BOTBODRAFT_27778 [Botryobasidium botryosum FD-172 SS1]
MAESQIDETGLPACLLPPFPPVLKAPLQIDGSDPSLSTEVLPAPPPISFIQVPPKRDLKRPYISFLPTSDPGTTYGTGAASTLALGAAPDDPIRRTAKRARVEKTHLNRAQRASNRSNGTPSPADAQSAGTTATAESGSGKKAASDSPAAELETLQIKEERDVVSDGERADDDRSATPVEKKSRGKSKGKQKEKVGKEPVEALPEPDAPSINQDHCSACFTPHYHTNSPTSFLYCDGCPRSFHLSCLDPPVFEQSDIPSEKEWFCPSCHARKHPLPKPPKHAGIFDLLLYQLHSTIPTVYQLPSHIRGFFKDVNTGIGGQYIDSGDIKPARSTRQGFLEERDPYRLKDRNNKPILCFKCNRSAAPPTLEEPRASIPSKRVRLGHTSTPTSAASSTTTLASSSGKSILSCDHCNLHWHLDCLDPPLVIMPPSHKKWMCPNHADRLLPKRRVPKSGVETIQITEQGQRNNGIIDVVPSGDGGRGAASSRGTTVPYDETWINNQRYQVPEETIVLDFWDKLGKGKATDPRERRSISPRKADVRMHSCSRSSPPSSPLTSLSSLDGDAEDEERRQPPTPMPTRVKFEKIDDMNAVKQLTSHERVSAGVEAPDVFNSQEDASRLHAFVQFIFQDLATHAPTKGTLPLEHHGTAKLPFASPAVSAATSPQKLSSEKKPSSFTIRIPAASSRTDSSRLRRSRRRQPSETSSAPSDLPPQDTLAAAAKSSNHVTTTTTANSTASPALTPEEIQQLKNVRELMLLKGPDKMLEFLRST